MTSAPEHSILLADDEELVRSVGGAMLTSLGYDVVLAEDGAHALDLYTRHREHIEALDIDYDRCFRSGGVQRGKLSRGCGIQDVCRTDFHGAVPQ